MIISFKEIIYFIILTGVVGYIFTGFFRLREGDYKAFDWRDFKFAAMISAPSIILHELAHKFTAMAYGLNASFEIFPFGLALGVFLKLIHAPFLIIAPGYVTIPFIQDPISYRLIAFAGPLINLVLWGVASFVLKKKKDLSQRQFIAISLFKKLNVILFFFNMIPFGPFDGAKVLFGPG